MTAFAVRTTMKRVGMEAKLNALFGILKKWLAPAATCPLFVRDIYKREDKKEDIDHIRFSRMGITFYPHLCSTLWNMTQGVG